MEEIIRCLRNDSRAKIKDISRKTGIPPSTVHNRIRKNNVVIKNTVLFDYKRLSYPLLHIFVIEAKEIDDHKSINNIYTAAGNKMILECIFSDLAERENFMSFLNPRARVISEFPVIKELAKEKFFT